MLLYMLRTTLLRIQNMSTKKKAVNNPESGYEFGKAAKQVARAANAELNKEHAGIDRSKLFQQASTTEEGLLEYEKYAVEGLCEVITKGYTEVGMQSTQVKQQAAIKQPCRPCIYGACRRWFAVTLIVLGDVETFAWRSEPARRQASGLPPAQAATMARAA